MYNDSLQVPNNPPLYSRNLKKYKKKHRHLSCHLVPINFAAKENTKLGKKLESPKSDRSCLMTVRLRILCGWTLGIENWTLYPNIWSRILRQRRFIVLGLAQSLDRCLSAKPMSGIHKLNCINITIFPHHIILYLRIFDTDINYFGYWPVDKVNIH